MLSRRILLSFVVVIGCDRNVESAGNHDTQINLDAGVVRYSDPEIQASVQPQISSAAAEAKPDANLFRCPIESRLVGAGSYTLGIRPSELEAQDPLPRKQYLLATPICVDESEVTVRSYETCVVAGACKVPSNGAYCNYGKSAKSNHPVNCITRDQARTYCQYMGKRLPREEEWEAAARGLGELSSPFAGEGLKLPSIARSYCINRGPSEGTCPVNEVPFEGGNNLRGLSGNVREWTESTMCENDSCPTLGVVRGGASSVFLYSSVAYAARHSTDPRDVSPRIGIRCVAELHTTR